MITFYKWLKKQKNRNDNVSDLAYDVLFGSDEENLKNNYSTWNSYLFKRNACDDAVTTLKQAWGEYTLEKRNSELHKKLATSLRSRINSSLKGKIKLGSHVKDLGCSIEELKVYLENKFKKGMKWNNWNMKGWHIDHKIPLARFDLSNKEEFLKACHYTNLQPLWAKENLSKGKKILQ